jgi:hypothetical protein
MANTYTLISSVTVGSGGASTIDFTSIPSTYTDLCILFSVRANNSASSSYGFGIRFNSATSNYTDRWVRGSGSSVSSSTATGSTSIYVGEIPSTIDSSNYGNGMVYIPNYAGSNNKTLSFDTVQERNDTTAYITFGGGLYSSSSAITSITLLSSQNLTQYSNAYLYGISNA